MTIPIIDFAIYDEKKLDTLTQLAHEVDRALTNWGFISLKNIGIDTELRKETFANAREFFNRPLEEKRRYAYMDPKANFGYQAPLTETLEPGQPADLKEAFTMRDLQGHLTDDTAWPDEAFRLTAQSFFEACMQAAFRVLRVLAVALEEDPEYFVKLHSGENVTMRYLHYPSSGFDVAKEQMGAGAHTDYGVVTLLFQDHVGGLQLKNGATWIDIPPMEGTANINTGDLMMHWSNGRYPSTCHRVLPLIGNIDRYSIAFFTDPDGDTEVDCLSSCVSEAHPKRYAAITAGEHIQRKIDRSQSPEMGDYP